MFSNNYHEELNRAKKRIRDFVNERCREETTGIREHVSFLREHFYTQKPRVKRYRAITLKDMKEVIRTFPVSIRSIREECFFFTVTVDRDLVISNQEMIRKEIKHDILEALYLTMPYGAKVRVIVL